MSYPSKSFLSFLNFFLLNLISGLGFGFGIFNVDICSFDDISFGVFSFGILGFGISGFGDSDKKLKKKNYSHNVCTMILDENHQYEKRL